MVINRALRATSVVVLAVLTTFFGIGLRHDAPHRIQAQDTTWAAPATDADGDAGKSQPSDTTWAIPESGDSDVAQLQRADTTW
ncbi:hypothetical protein [Streptomyces sp. NPDC017958]|uniref:hypothetical protein n=1 Tax=Streptomyces sp. NPDC017958 TaxID=3365021 RepID=UPI00378DFC40